MEKKDLKVGTLVIDRWFSEWGTGEIPEEEFRKQHALGLSDTNLSEIFNIDSNTVRKYRKFYNLEQHKHIRPKHSEEYKSKISLLRKEWLKNNPDAHPWKKGNRATSIPCEKLKEFLLQKNLTFISEFSPNVGGRFFSLDIAFPDKLIGLEINGNQHYERDGTLKPYYQERHDILESNGWKIYEIPYTLCFNLEKLSSIIDELYNSPIKKDFDYLNFVPKTKKVVIKKEKTIKVPNICKCGNIMCTSSKKCKVCCTSSEIRSTVCECGNPKCDRALTCDKCFRFRNTKVKVKPSKEELEKLIEQFPMTKIGEMFGVSDVAIKKWAKNAGINLPDRRGFWAKKQANKI